MKTELCQLNKTKIICILIFLWSFCLKNAQLLTGHVCRRQKEETYKVTTSTAFLCNERYTTSCGHLDWRRCTKYRVQTCYTPSERYAVRYREVEECCPGWQEEAGSCSIRVCYGLCQNGGECTQMSPVPHCSCLPGFYGEFCQHKETSDAASEAMAPWTISLIVVIAIVVIVDIAAVVYICCKRKREGSQVHVKSEVKPQDTHQPQPAAAPAETIRQPSAPEEPVCRSDDVSKEVSETKC